MKDILTAPFVKEMQKTTANMYRLGWDERNGGNISYMLDEDKVGEYLDLNSVIRTIPTGFDATELIGKYQIHIIVSNTKSDSSTQEYFIVKLCSMGSGKFETSHITYHLIRSPKESVSFLWS